MNLETIVPMAEQIVVDPDVAVSENAVPGCRFFSYRHAEKLHALGLVREFSPEQSRYLQVSVSIVISEFKSSMFWARILWLRQKGQLPFENGKSWRFPISEIGIQSFAAAWPEISGRFEAAVHRRRPPILRVFRDMLSRRKAL